MLGRAGLVYLEGSALAQPKAIGCLESSVVYLGFRLSPV